MTLRERLNSKNARIRADAKRQQALHEELRKELAGWAGKARGGVSPRNGNSAVSRKNRADAAVPARTVQPRICPTATQTLEQPWWTA